MVDYESLSKELCQLHIQYAGAMNSLSHLMEIKGEEGLLIWLSQKTNKVYASDIAQHFSLTSGRVANILRSLEKKGLLVRRKDSNDLRKVLVEITTDGRAFANEEYQKMIAGHWVLLERLGKEDALKMLHLFNRMMTIVSDDALKIDM